MKHSQLPLKTRPTLTYDKTQLIQHKLQIWIRLRHLLICKCKFVSIRWTLNIAQRANVNLYNNGSHLTWSEILSHAHWCVEVLGSRLYWNHDWRHSSQACSSKLIRITTRNKSNDYFESLQYRQDVRHIAHYHKRKHFSSYTRISLILRGHF